MKPDHRDEGLEEVFNEHDFQASGLDGATQRAAVIATTMPRYLVHGGPQPHQCRHRAHDQPITFSQFDASRQKSRRVINVLQDIKQSNPLIIVTEPSRIVSNDVQAIDPGLRTESRRPAAQFEMHVRTVSTVSMFDKVSQHRSGPAAYFQEPSGTEQTHASQKPYDSEIATGEPEMPSLAAIESLTGRTVRDIEVGTLPIGSTDDEKLCGVNKAMLQAGCTHNFVLATTNAGHGSALGYRPIALSTTSDSSVLCFRPITRECVSRDTR